MTEKSGYYLDGKEARQAIRFTEEFFLFLPKNTRGKFRKIYKSNAEEAADRLKAVSYSGRGGHSLGRGPGIRTDKGAYGIRRFHTADLKVNSKFTGKADTMGGFSRVGWDGREFTSAQHIAFFHEFGTKYHAAREPLATGWKMIKRFVTIEEDVGAEMDKQIKKWSKRK